MEWREKARVNTRVTDEHAPGRGGRAAPSPSPSEAAATEPRGMSVKERRELSVGLFCSARCTRAGTVQRARPYQFRVAIRAWQFFFILFFVMVITGISRAETNEQRSLILVVGAPGEAEYAQEFSTAADLWKQTAAKGGLQITTIGMDDTKGSDDRAQLLNVMSNEVAKPAGELWLVFLGHGTFDGHAAKFNLRGPDISAEELGAALKPCRRPLAVIQCASSSGPFLKPISGPGRVVITATRSGYEVNATRFGGFLARAIADPAADLDKDGQTSLLEAFLQASRQVEQFYKEQGRLMTEHALLDDNGDGLGTPPDWFHGLRAAKTAAEGKSVDGVRAHQMMLVRGEAEQKLPPDVRARRDELEQKLSALRTRKAQMKEDDYYHQLEEILVETARIYQGK